MRARLLLAPAALLLTSGCLASKGDIRLLQDDLTSMRADQAQQARAQEQARALADAATRQRLDSALASLGVLRDSVRILSGRIATYQANSSQSMYELGQQLVTLLNRAGMSQQQIQALMAQLEAQQQAAPAAPPAAGRRDSTAPPAGPGPAQLFMIGRDQYNLGAYSTARMAFDSLLAKYPTYLGAASAQNYIALSYEGEGKNAEADSVYQSVVRQYPQSSEAPTALYKHALYLIKTGKTADARAALTRIVRDYATSDVGKLAADQLRKLPTP
ncbi:MAG: tetratricopeptide repeat protein [Gemmatimonadota bacterium]|nr:tetratricopeptide repeat protein [Gemmatimonadota bacterium]